MVDILHKVGITSSSPDAAYKALTRLEGLFRLVDDRHARGNQSRRRNPVPLWGRRHRHPGSRASPLRARAVAGGRWAPGMDRHKSKFRPPAGRRLDHCPLQARGLEGAGGVHAPLQHQMGGLSLESEVTARNREKRRRAKRYQARQLGIKLHRLTPFPSLNRLSYTWTPEQNR
jgi:hypothetical protein